MMAHLNSAAGVSQFSKFAANDGDDEIMCLLFILNFSEEYFILFLEEEMQTSRYPVQDERLFPILFVMF